jgi:hypothetical protein
LAADWVEQRDPRRIDVEAHRLAACQRLRVVHDARRWAPGDKVAFAIDAARVSLFDPRTGNRL